MTRSHLAQLARTGPFALAVALGFAATSAASSAVSILGGEEGPAPARAARPGGTTGEPAGEQPGEPIVPRSRGAVPRSRGLTAEEQHELVSLLDAIADGPRAHGSEVRLRESGYADALFDVKRTAALARRSAAKAAEASPHAPAGDEPYQALGERLAVAPGGWDVLVPELRLRFAQPSTSPAARGRLLRVLSRGRGAAARALALELWNADRGAFSDDHVVAFAEAGSAPFEDEARARAARPDASVLLAARAALRGEDLGPAGPATLAAALEPVPRDPADCVRAALAAAGLGALGDAAAPDAQRRRLHDAVLAALDAGELDRARALALSAELLAEALAAPPGRAHLAFLGERTEQHLAARHAAVASADQIFALIEAITPK